MKVGDNIYLYERKHNAKPSIYNRNRGKIVRFYNKGKCIQAVDIEEMFKSKVGSNNFAKFYAERIQGERVIMKDIKGKYHLILSEVWENKKVGDDTYLEIIPSSVMFILGDD